MYNVLSSQDTLIIFDMTYIGIFTKNTFQHNHIDGLMQERCNSIDNALELHLSCTNPS